MPSVWMPISLWPHSPLSAQSYLDIIPTFTWIHIGWKMGVLVLKMTGASDSGKILEVALGMKGGGAPTCMVRHITCMGFRVVRILDWWGGPPSSLLISSPGSESRAWAFIKVWNREITRHYKWMNLTVQLSYTPMLSNIWMATPLYFFLAQVSTTPTIPLFNSPPIQFQPTLTNVHMLSALRQNQSHITWPLHAFILAPHRDFKNINYRRTHTYFYLSMHYLLRGLRLINHARAHG